MIAGLALALLQAVPDPSVAAPLAEGRHQLAMAAAARLEPGTKEANEAEVLYLARSYDEALVKVREALAAGAPASALLLSRGVSSAIWIGDLATGDRLLADLRRSVEAMPEGERPGWTSHADELTGFLEERRARRAATDAARSRARFTAGCLGVAALGGLALGLRSWRRRDA